jgi:hypothetical protein
MTLGLSDFVRMTEVLQRGPTFDCGHPKTPENTYRKGAARCLQCKREHDRAYALERYRKKYG